MARSVTIGNGEMLVGLDGRGQVRDLYYPFVGEANHVSGASGNHVHRIGVFVDGEISWLESDEWKMRREQQSQDRGVQQQFQQAEPATPEPEPEPEEEGHTCPQCGKTFDTERGLHIHQAQKHE